MAGMLAAGLIGLAAITSALVAGFFFAFSVVVMRALQDLPAANGIAAMQRINVVVLNPWFFSAFFGTAAICLVLTFLAVSDWPSLAARTLQIRGSSVTQIDGPFAETKEHLAGVYVVNVKDLDDAVGIVTGIPLEPEHRIEIRPILEIDASS